MDLISGPPHNPGHGGWPTIRYFNKETGLAGGNYQKKTSKSMCDELGNVEAMTEYVEQYGNIVTCEVDTSGCSPRETKYVNKWKAKTPAETSAELVRLEGMNSSHLAPDLKKWLGTRKKILKKIEVAAASMSDEL